MRSSLAFVAALLAVATTGCSAGGGAPSLPAGAGASTAQTAARVAPAVLAQTAPVAATSPAVDAETVDALSATGSGLRHLYVGNATTNTITVYDKLARGNVAPVRAIGGPKSGITCLRQIAVDARGFVYVAVFSTNATPYGYCDSSGGGEVLVFAPGASGNVAPVRTIKGPTTTIGNASAVAVDPAGTLYVGSMTVDINGAQGRLLRFAPGASGDVAPTASSTSRCASFDGLTLDPTLGVIASSSPCAPNFATANVGYYSADLATGGPAIAYDDPGALASDPATHTYLGVGTIFGPRIDRYADGSTGAYAPNAPGGPFVTPGLVSSLSISTCPAAVAIGPMRTSYVAGTCPDSIEAFAPDAAGSTPPLRTISGSATELAGPRSVIVGP